MIKGSISFDRMKPVDVIPLGRIAIDFNPHEINCPLADSETFTKYVGGSPANIAVGLARLGKKIGFLGRISDDAFGDYVEQVFRKEGIDTSHIKRCANGEKLGLAFTEILSPQESGILMYRDRVADLQLSPEDVDEAYIASSKALLISGTSLCASPSREAALKAMELAKKNGVVVVFDIDYRPYTWRSDEEVSVYYSIVGRNSDIILGSREEFDLMEKLLAGAASDDEASAKLWFSHGVKILVIKHGKEGSVAYTCSGKRYTIKPFPVKKRKSTGGGDGYASAFLYGLLEDWEIGKALEFGNASASMLIAAVSCSSSMPDAEGISAFIEEAKQQCQELICETDLSI